MKILRANQTNMTTLVGQLLSQDNSSTVGPFYTRLTNAQNNISLLNTFVSSFICIFIHSFIHSGHFYSTPSSPLLPRGAPDYSTDTVSEFHAEANRQLQVKDLPKVPTWRLERESNPRPSG